MKKFTRNLVIAVAVLMMSLVSAAQAETTVNPGTQSVAVTAVIGESISMTVSGGPFVIPTTGASGPVTVAYTWNLVPANHTSGGGNGLQTASWFSSSTAALAGPSNIPATSLSESRNGNVIACGASNPQQVAGAGCHYTQLIGGGAALTAQPQGTGLDTYSLSYSGGGSLAAGNYSGTWNVVIWAN